ncbi:MAG: hypothetical protein JXR34_05640 [Bacteroidales bacterium]|nr:hypothetical protein [Bacteroidales bacterium]
MKYINIGIIIFLTLTSCKKDGNIFENNLSNNNQMEFKTIQDFKMQLDAIKNMSIDERIKYEDSKGYKSFGRVCDEFYYSINFDQFSSQEEILNFVEKNSDKLKLTKESNGEYRLETQLSTRSARYLIGEDFIYIIGNQAYKLFNNGIAVSSKDNIKELKTYNPKQVSNQFISKVTFIEDIDYNSILKDPSYDCGEGYEVDVTNGRNRTQVKTVLDLFSFISGVSYSYGAEFQVRPYHRTLGIWYWCNRTIMADSKLAVGGPSLDGSSKYSRIFAYSYTNGHYGSSWTSSTLWITYFTPSPPDVHFDGIDSWGDTYDTPPANIECYTELF